MSILLIRTHESYHLVSEPWLPGECGPNEDCLSCFHNLRESHHQSSVLMTLRMTSAQVVKIMLHTYMYTRMMLITTKSGLTPWYLLAESVAYEWLILSLTELFMHESADLHESAYESKKLCLLI